MSEEFAFVSIKGLSAKTIKGLNAKTLTGSDRMAHAWAIAFRHNYRFAKDCKSISPDGYGTIDPARSHLNVALRGERNWDRLLMSVCNLLGGAKIRANAKCAIELVFSLRAGAAIDQVSYFNDCVTWAEGYYPCPLVSAVVHADQKNPHCHVLLLPLLDGRLQGDKVMGYKATTKAMHLDFYEKVARGYGLAHPAAVSPLGASAKQKRMDAARNALATAYGIPGPVLDALLTPDADVGAVLRAMGIETQGGKRGASAVVKLMTRKTKPEKSRPMHGGFKSDGSVAPTERPPKIKPPPCVLHGGSKNLH